MKKKIDNFIKQLEKSPEFMVRVISASGTPELVSFNSPLIYFEHFPARIVNNKKDGLILLQLGYPAKLFSGHAADNLTDSFARHYQAKLKNYYNLDCCVVVYMVGITD